METTAAPNGTGDHAERVALVLDRRRVEKADDLDVAMAGIREGITQLARDVVAGSGDDREALDALRALLDAYDRVRDVQHHLDDEPNWREYVEAAVDEYPPRTDGAAA